VQQPQRQVVQTFAGARQQPAQPQRYVIRQAGTVSVAASKSGLRLADVAARPGWKWSLEQTSDRKLTVTFRKGARTLTFLAHLGPSHTIVARVDKPVTRVAPSAPSGSVVAMSAPPATSGAAASAAPASASNGDDGEPGTGGEADD
jgi:hypothetical protein